MAVKIKIKDACTFLGLDYTNELAQRMKLVSEIHDAMVGVSYQYPNDYIELEPVA